MTISEILSKYNLKYEELNPLEKETLKEWLALLAKAEVTKEDILDYIQRMKSSVEMELSDTKLDKKRDIFLKARLRNYLLLEAFLTSPEKAKKLLNQRLKSLK